ncbi:MAG: class I SAM-dependent methyltransferase [Methylococcales bacterium]
MITILLSKQGIILGDGVTIKIKVIVYKRSRYKIDTKNTFLAVVHIKNIATMNIKRQLPDWENRYQQVELDLLPWFYPDLDPDIEQALADLSIQTGKVLDLGSGPGTQAIALAKAGFEVIATDVSITAIKKASQTLPDTQLPVTFQQDDILQSKLEENFDLIIDRGVFHVFSEQQRAAYLDSIEKLIKPRGYLLLKTFSYLETSDEGPHRFTAEQICQLFTDHFNVISIVDSCFIGPEGQAPKALFCIMQRTD